MSYSRRRVPLACTFCRHRKRRCDANRPSCSNCIEAEADCHYADLPVRRFEADDPSTSNAEILNKLQGIEGLLESHAQSMEVLSTEIQSRLALVPNPSSSPLSQTSTIDAVLTASRAQRSNDNGPTSPWFYDAPGLQTGGADLPVLTIPAKHITSSNYLLCLPEMKALIGEYPTNLFSSLESRNPLPSKFIFDGWQPMQPIVHIDREITDYLVSVFFSEVHPCHPILDHDTFSRIYARFLETGVDSSVQSALCLVVLALGSIALPSDGPHDFETSLPGMQYMQSAMPALIVMSAWSLEWNILLPQALVLASIYFAYIVRPLQSWRLVYSASTILQFKLSRLRAQEGDASEKEGVLRLFWSCFLIECDRLAELELPQSGLQQLTDEVTLPSCNNLNETESTCYLAEISIRRLLNRIHNSLYPQKHATSLNASSPSNAFPSPAISSIRGICDELHRQLNMWYESIPETVRPALDFSITANDRQQVLRIRYYATKHIIYRPFVLHVVAYGATEPVDDIMEKCEICLEACRIYLYNTTEIMKRASQYTWTFSLSSLGAIVVLTLASLCPSLKRFVPDIHELQTRVIENVKPWASPNSSLEAVISIIQDIRRKQRMLASV
ncbi:uncharacterized protein BP5553_06072 [Venustampulla echinocandica]|uniref:Zn(2)-C6 fungal-type domain-containing protein n=1 Tax=Venustampulla echinocandica TaxID=2656787 RepID=A0A370TMG9_9HELO|nr:uncharacterized protein BP5553_06072 [Venustampulla echinocandica]RDL36720.1 hypothetical protein BP5553_06072 [Venustampulla echinocandica]